MDGAEPKANEVIVDDAEIVAVKIAPDDRNEGRGDDDRQEKGEPEEIEQDGGHLAIERQSEEHPHADVSGHGE